MKKEEPLGHVLPLDHDRRQLTGALTRREEFYRSVLDSLAEGVVITNSESRIIYANQAMQEISGYSRDEMMGKISYEVLAPRQNWPKMQRRLKERLSGKTENYEHELVRKDGRTHWVAVKATPYRDPNGVIIGTVGAINCIDRQKRLEQENEYLVNELKATGMEATEIVGSSPALRKVMEQIAMVGPTCANVLIFGESGTGKELVAKAIHERSDRKGKPLVRVNCASVPKDLFESEFFGHVKGAFTGAVRDRIGRFELAHGGTLFLDEVGEIPLDLQAKLLRVLQEGTFERLGEERTRKVNARIIAATNRDLLEASKSGRFRIDLYYRLSVFPVEIPALRERPEDILPLAQHFLQISAGRLGLKGLQFTTGNIDELTKYDWPGNVRELQNVIERAVIISQGGELVLNLLRPGASRSSVVVEDRGGTDIVALSSIKKQERELIARALKESGGKIYGADGAAALLGLRPTTLASKIQRMGINKKVL